MPICDSPFRKLFGSAILSPGKGKCQKMIEVPVYEEDDYASILYRFLVKFGDEGMIDVLLTLENPSIPMAGSPAIKVGDKIHAQPYKDRAPIEHYALEEFVVLPEDVIEINDRAGTFIYHEGCEYLFHEHVK